jgi:uncharacterized lipoprotein YddW (UPF0748 family)
MNIYPNPSTERNCIPLYINLSKRINKTLQSVIKFLSPVALPKKTTLVVLTAGIITLSCSKESSPSLPDEEMPAEFNSSTDRITIKHEFRAAWLTTVGNYDWPPKNSTPDVQISTLIGIIDMLKTLNFNVILFHIRPTSDAFYQSSLVPWSVYLTGTQGVYPGYDPLQVAIEAAHERGMELHAWLNPYRIGSTSVTLAANHPAVIHPSWCIVYNNNRYLDPGLPEVKDHLQDIVEEIIDNYDVDGIHFDDYFYPSGAKSTSNPFGFNDQATYNTYGAGLDLDAWREKNVDDMVRGVSQIVRSLKPEVVFGISPQGKHENSMTVYANSLTWMQNKWIDYLAPQIYWQIGHATADFATVIRYWNNNSFGVPVIPGLAAYKYGDSDYPAYTLSELANEVNMTRSFSSMSGNCWFRVAHVLGTSLSKYIQSSIYAYPSLIPKLGNYTGNVPSAPNVTLNDKTLNWAPVEEAEKYVVYELSRDGKTSNWTANAVQINNSTSYQGKSEKNYIVISVSGKEKSSYNGVKYVK